MKRVALALLVVASLIQPVAAAETTTLTVSVVDESGSPIGDATLTASWEDGATTRTTTRTTASNGKAFVDVPDGADVTIRMEHESYVRNHPLEITNAAAESVEMTIYPKAAASVQVEDADGRVADASVRLVKHGQVAVRGRTDGTGTFETGVIEAGTYDVRVRKPGYYEHESAVAIANKSIVPLDIQRGSAVVDFNVTDDHFEHPRPIVGAAISVDGFGSVKTLDDGENAMRLPVNTKFSVSVEKAEYQNTTGTISVGESDTRENVTMQRAPSISLATVSERVVAGEKLRLDVTNEYGAPVSNATVLVDGQSIGETNDDGVFVAIIESGGEHEIAAEQGSLASAAVTVTAISSDTPTATSEPTEEATASPTAGGTTDESPGVGMPGFEFVIAVAGLALAVGLARFRTR